MAVSQELEREIADYDMPTIRVGSPVRWYRNGTAKQDSIFGWATRVRKRSITVHLVNGQRYVTVRHVSDPKLKLSQEQRDNGAWDYTESYINEQKIEDLQKLVAKLDANRIVAMENVIEKLSREVEALKKQIEKPKK